MSNTPEPAVIDLTATVRIERGDDAFAHLSDDEKRRVLVRVFCELVAYGELIAAEG